MFTPQDFYKLTQDYVKLLPKNEKEVKEVAEKAKTVFLAEAKKAAEVVNTYQKATTGEASLNDIAIANKKAQSLAVTARFAAFVAIPGAIFAVPAIAKAAKEYDFEFIPESVAKEFNL